MSELWTSIIVPIALAIVSGGGVGWLTVRATVRQINAGSKKSEAEAGDVLVGSAGKLVDMLTEELERERAFRQETVLELRTDIDREREARKADAQRCEAEIQLRDTEITILKRELNKLSRKLMAHENSIKKLKTDTDDLALRTPPPAVDPTPPLPTRSTFQDNPSDQPPDDAA